MVLESKTKSILINAPVSKVFAFVANLANWPKWAIQNIVAAKPGSGDWWATETRTGLGRIRIKPDEASGTLDYELLSAGVQWSIAARVVAKNEGSEFTLTFTPPPAIAQEAFEKMVGTADKELLRLKDLMES